MVKEGMDDEGEGERDVNLCEVGKGKDIKELLEEYVMGEDDGKGYLGVGVYND